MRRTLAIAALAACVVSGVSACGSSKKATPPPPPTDLRGRATVEIDARANQFTPAGVIVDVGTKVTWRNTDTVAHNVEKSADTLNFGAPFGVDAGAFNPGASYSFTFTTAGTFPYTCTIHTLMNGTVQVVAKA